MDVIGKIFALTPLQLAGIVLKPLTMPQPFL